MEFIKDNRKELIANALLAGQRKIEIEGVEIILNPLKRDTQKNKIREANKVANNLISILNN